MRSGLGRAEIEKGGGHAADGVLKRNDVERAFLSILHRAMGRGAVLHLEVEKGHQKKNCLTIQSVTTTSTRAIQNWILSMPPSQRSS